MTSGSGRRASAHTSVPSMSRKNESRCCGRATEEKRLAINRAISMGALVLRSVLVYAVLAQGWCGKCRDTAWEKIVGVKPEFVNSTSALFTGVNSNGIVASCFSRCRQKNCTGFVIDARRSVCYSVVPSTDDELLPDADTIFYQQICIKVPPSCKRDRLWHVERTPGAIIIDSNAIRATHPISRTQCYERCIEAGQRCKSAQFHTTRALSANDTVGKCTLSMYDRGTRPQAYRVSMYRDEYLQDQCHPTPKRDYCSYAEFRNASLPYSDLAVPKLDEKQCERRCDLSADGFVCRSYSVDYGSSDKPTCLLHSEDTTSLGVSSLVAMPNVTYREREPCLDLKVRCDDASLTVELRTNEPFFGRVYVTGHSEDCGVQGVGRNVTALTLPLPKPEELRSSNLECGLNPAFSLDDQNRTRTLLWTTIVVQFNPIIQRLGDQAIRVGCSLDNRDVPEPRNISVHSSFSFLDPNAGVPPIASTVVNISSEAPVVTMRILDENSKDAVVTQLGEKLTLKIEIKPADGPYDIAAGHLVASSASGESSYLLLDELGCPTDSATFPALTKDPVDNRSLISNFTAFKFPDSQLVRFNVMVRFCADDCKPANCRGGQISYGRRRRSSDTGDDVSEGSIGKVTEVSRNEMPDELPLQLSIIVQSPVISADPLLSRENVTPDTVLIAGGNSVDGLFCIDASLALGLLIFWLIVQIALIVGCLLAVGQYRKMAIQAEEDRADILARHLYGIHGGNFEIARRVRWADRNSSSSLDVRA